MLALRILPPQGLGQIALVVVDGDLQRHLPNRVGGAGKAGVVRPNRMFNPVEHAFFDVGTVHVFLGDHINRFAHGIVVMPG